jgi:hypothetical protein
VEIQMALPKLLPDQAYLQACFLYDEERGKLFWRTRPIEHFLDDRARKIWNARFAGTEAGSVPLDRRYVVLDYKRYSVSRMIFKLQHGRDPVGLVDHRNTDPENNKIDNIREATYTQNNMNMKLRSNNTSGFKGVSWSAKRKKFIVQIRMNNKITYVGQFDSAEKASEAYQKAALALFGEFARFN